MLKIRNKTTIYNIIMYTKETFNYTVIEIIHVTKFVMYLLWLVCKEKKKKFVALAQSIS